MLGEIAQRDRQKQIMLMNYDDDTLADIKTKANKLRDDPQIDLDIRLQLWKETVHVRRKALRNQATSEILQEFPEYKDPVLIFEEVKMIMGVNLRAVVRCQIPVLLDKMIVAPVFITGCNTHENISNNCVFLDSPPVQLIRVLCRQFEEAVHHLYCNT
ncbi:unnamed protein product, partial [Rotaria socialis]